MSVVVALQSDLSGSVDLRGAQSPSRWLYVGDDSAWRVHAEQALFAGMPRIDSARALQQAAWDLRRPFIDWVGELSEVNASIEWWASQLAAKNSYTMFYNRFCSLAAALELVGSGEASDTLVVTSSPALAAEVARLTGGARLPPARAPRSRPSGRTGLRAWARVAPRPLRALPARLSDRARLSLDSDPRYRKRILAEHGVLEPRAFAGDGTCLLFTWVDERNFDDAGGYRDPHLGVLPELLRARGLRVAYVPRVLHSLPFDDAVPRLLATGEEFHFLDAYLELDDLRECVRRVNGFVPTIDDDATVGGIPIAALARELVAGSRPSQAGALSVEPLLRHFAAAGVRPERIVHTYEGHSWELVLAEAARSFLPDTVVVGYENANMTRLALSMFPAASELGLRPLPDRIVTNGPAYREVLVAEGVPAELVWTGCGLRHSYIWDEPATHNEPQTPARVLVATDSALGQAVELVEKAARAFGFDPAFELVVKCHPLLAEAAVRSLLGPAASGASFRFSEQPIGDLLREADLMLYTYSIVCYEALARGVPPLFVRAETALDLDQLEPFETLRWAARTPDELREAARAIGALTPADRVAWRAEARAAAAAAFAPPTSRCVEAFVS